MNAAHRILLASALVLGSAALAGAAGLDEPAPQNTRRLWVPFDHQKTEEGSFLLQYEFGQPFNPELPTVFVVADALPGNIPPGPMADLQQEVFGPDMNVVGIIPRGTVKELLGQLRTSEGTIDWAKAWRYLKAEQWSEDIETVRRELLKERRVHLFGHGGGAFLIHQYLTHHGKHVERVFSRAAATPYLDAELGIAAHKNEAPQAGAEPRHHATTIVATRVRRFELSLPGLSPRSPREDTGGLGSEETPADVHPLFVLYQEGAISPPTMDFTSLEHLNAEVLVLAGRRDPTTSRRSQASLAARYPSGELLLVDDDQTFGALESSGLYPSLVQTFLRSGLQNKTLRKIFSDLEDLGGNP